MPADQLCRAGLGDHPRTQIPRVQPHAQSGVDAVSRARLDDAGRLRAFARADGALGADVLAGDQAPPAGEVFARLNGPARLNTATGIDFLLRGHAAACLDALTALDGALRIDVLAGMQVAGHGQVLSGADVPLGAHIAAAIQARRNLDPPVGRHVAAGAQVAAAGNVAAGGDVFTRHDRLAGAKAAARDKAASRAHHRVHIDPHADFKRPGKHDGGGIQRIQPQHGVGRTKLVQQPAGVADAAVGDQGIEHGLIVPLSVVVAQEPFVAARARVLGFDEFFGELHGAESKRCGAWTPRKPERACERRNGDERPPRGSAPAGRFQAAGRADVRRQPATGRSKNQNGERRAISQAWTARKRNARRPPANSTALSAGRRERR